MIIQIYNIDENKKNIDNEKLMKNNQNSNNHHNYYYIN